MKCRLCRWLKMIKELEQPGYQQGRYGAAWTLRDLAAGLHILLCRRETRI